MTPPRVLALIAAYNEADVIGACIGALVEQGCDAYLIDNASTDGTAEVAREWLGRGLIGIERFPDDVPGFSKRSRDTMVWVDLLKRRQQLVQQHDYDWYVLNDADEFREAPWPGATFAEGLGRAEALGYNAVGFRVYDFRPVDESFRSGADPREVLTGYEAGGNWDAAQVKAFKRPEAGLDIVRYGGHDVLFPDRRVFPVPFLLRHYPIRSAEHGTRKVLTERIGRFAPEEREAGWHVQYDQLLAEGRKFVWEPSELATWDPAAVRAELLAGSLDSLLLANVSRGFTTPGLRVNHDAMQKLLSDDAAPARYATARRVFDAVCQRAIAPEAAPAHAGEAAPLVSKLLAALVAQAEVDADPRPLAHAQLLQEQFDGALAAAPVPLDGARSFVALVRAEELVREPALAGAFTSAFDASSDATLVIHAPGWSDDDVAARLLPALSTVGLDAPDAPDAMALTVEAGPRSLAASVHAVLTGEQDVLEGVPHVGPGAGDALRELALNFAHHAPITGP